MSTKIEIGYLLPAALAVAAFVAERADVLGLTQPQDIVEETAEFMAERCWILPEDRDEFVRTLGGAIERNRWSL